VLHTSIHRHTPHTSSDAPPATIWTAPDILFGQARCGWYVRALFLLYRSCPDALPLIVGSDVKLSSFSFLLYWPNERNMIYSITFNTLPIAIVLPRDRNK